MERFITHTRTRGGYYKEQDNTEIIQNLPVLSSFKITSHHKMVTRNLRLNTRLERKKLIRGKLSVLYLENLTKTAEIRDRTKLQVSVHVMKMLSKNNIFSFLR